MGSDLPEKFSIAGFGNGGFQAGLFASKYGQRIEKLFLLSPSQFCPAPTSNWNPYKEDASLAHLYENLKEMEGSQVATQRRLSDSLHC